MANFSGDPNSRIDVLSFSEPILACRFCGCGEYHYPISQSFRVCGCPCHWVTGRPPKEIRAWREAVVYYHKMEISALLKELEKGA